MGEVSTIGLDIAKSVFQVHGVDVAGGGHFSALSAEPRSRGRLQQVRRSPAR
jgi:transposase